MSVIYAPNGGGSNPLGILGSLFSVIPGMQPIGMGLGALGSAIKGDTVGTAMNLAGMGKKTAPQPPTPPAPQFNWVAPDYSQMWQDFNKNRGMY